MNTPHARIILPVALTLAIVGVFAAFAMMAVQAQAQTAQPMDAQMMQQQGANPNWGAYDAASGMYYNSLTKLYYNPSTGLYYDATWNKYYTADGAVGGAQGGAASPGVPNTGMGGDATRNIALLLTSGAAALLGASYLWARREQVR